MRAQKLTGSQLNLAHGTEKQKSNEKKLKTETRFAQKKRYRSKCFVDSGLRTVNRGTVNRGTIKRGQLIAGQLIAWTHNRSDN